MCSYIRPRHSVHGKGTDVSPLTGVTGVNATGSQELAKGSRGGRQVIGGSPKCKTRLPNVLS